MADVLDIDNAEEFEVDDEGDRKFNNRFARNRFTQLNKKNITSLNTRFVGYRELFVIFWSFFYQRVSHA